MAGAVIAVDANGADHVTRRGRRGRAPFGPAGPAVRSQARAARRRRRAELIDAPETIKAGDEPVAAVRSRKEASIVQAAAAVAPGAPARSSSGLDGAHAGRRMIETGRMGGVFRPALAVLLPVPERPVLLPTRAPAAGPARAPRQFAYMGASFVDARVGIECPRVGLLSVGEESGKGAHARDPCRARPPGRGDAQLRRQRREVRPAPGDRRRDRGRRLRRQRRAQGARGHRQVAHRGRSRRGALGAGVERGRRADPRQLRGLRDELDPEGVGGAILLGLRKPVVVATAASAHAGSERGPAGAAGGRRGHGRAHCDGPRGGRGVAVRTRW